MDDTTRRCPIQPDKKHRMLCEKITTLVRAYMWGWRHLEGCFPLSEHGCICGLDSVKSILIDAWGIPSSGGITINGVNLPFKKPETNETT